MSCRTALAFWSSMPGSGTRRSRWSARLPARIACIAILVAPAIAVSAQPINRHPGWPGTTLSGVQCYGEGHGSRFEYISEHDKLAIVEKFHFYREIESLRMHDAKLDGDLDYTLRSIPNHHRALWARVRFYLRQIKDDQKRKELVKNEQMREGNPPPECYFERGEVFNPNDGMVPAIFGIYLHKRDQFEAALKAYNRAEALIPNDPELAYNMGLLYLDMGNLEKAREYADKASRLGYPLIGLRRKLSAAGSDPSASGASKAKSAVD